MRIIGRLPHPEMQITVFANDGRFPVQFELHGMSQQYRFRQGPGVNGLGEIAKLIDGRFLREVMVTFAAMAKTQARALPQEEGDAGGNDFPEII